MEIFYDLLPIFLLLFLIFDCIGIIIVVFAIYAEKMSEVSFVAEKEELPYVTPLTLVGFLFYMFMKNVDNIAFHYTDTYDVQIKLEGKTVNIWTLKKGSEELKNSVYIDKDEN